MYSGDLKISLKMNSNDQINSILTLSINDDLKLIYNRN